MKHWPPRSLFKPRLHSRDGSWNWVREHQFRRTIFLSTVCIFCHEPFHFNISAFLACLISFCLGWLASNNQTMVLISLIKQPQLEIRPWVWGMLLWNTWCVEIKPPCLTQKVMVACAGDGFQLPACCYATGGLFIICLVFHPSPISFLDRGILLFRTPCACPRTREKGK